MICAFASHAMRQIGPRKESASQSSYNRLKVVFGTCDAAALKELIKLNEVQRIEPLSS